MGRKVAAVRVGVSRISRPVWDKMLAAYRERPQIKHVMEIAGVGKKMARRAIMEGWPDHSLPPFVELEAGGTSVHKEMAKLRETWEESEITRGEAARQAAEEAMAARYTMGMALETMKLNRRVLAKIMEKISDDTIPIPEEMTPKILYQLTKSMDTAAAVVQKAMDVERKRMGEPEQVLGIQIGLLLDHCEDSELMIVMQTGDIPKRLLDQRTGSKAPGEQFTSDTGQVIDADVDSLEQEAIDADLTSAPSDLSTTPDGEPDGEPDDTGEESDEGPAMGQEEAAAV